MYRGPRLLILSAENFSTYRKSRTQDSTEPKRRPASGAEQAWFPATCVFSHSYRALSSGVKVETPLTHLFAVLTRLETRNSGTFWATMVVETPPKGYSGKQTEHMLGMAPEAARTATTLGTEPTTQARLGDSTTAGTTRTGGLAFPQAAQPRRFHGSVSLEPTRVGRDAGRIADEVISHLAGLVGADVNVTLEISADVQGGVPDKVVRTVTENCRTLKFKDQGFEDS
jgi:hypothetical protein